jgi:hypothetical protein
MAAHVPPVRLGSPVKRFWIEWFSFGVAGGTSMAFTVYRNDGGTKDSEFETYARLLR